MLRRLRQKLADWIYPTELRNLLGTLRVKEAECQYLEAINADNLKNLETERKRNEELMSEIRLLGQEKHKLIKNNKNLLNAKRKLQRQITKNKAL